RHTRFDCDWSSDVCSSDLLLGLGPRGGFTTGDVEAVTHEIAAERARDLPAADVTDVVALPGLTHLILESRRRRGARQDRRERRRSEERRVGEAGGHAERGP